MADSGLDGGRLREVHDLESLVELFSGELDWPLQDQEFDDLTFDYEAEEVGLTPDQAEGFGIRRLRRLRPLTSDQPWGIFLVEFEGPRLPVTALRRLLTSLVRKKRASSERQTWEMSDLLFFVSTSSGESLELHLLVFTDPPENSKTPEMRVLSWRPTQATDRHLDRVAGELLPNLAWPEDPADIEGWRKAWRSAMKLRPGEAIGSAKKLAERMAATARDLRELVQEELGREDGGGPFSLLMDEVRSELVSNLDQAEFADMCAQTIVYGMLTARITDPAAFGASPIFSGVPLSNPFLEAFFEQVHARVDDLAHEETDLEQLVADLRETHEIEAILDQFGAASLGGDPVIHFYEEFLALYDKKRKLEAGAFYTPQPVVEFMVRGVDQILRSEFGLPLGIADGSTWGEVAERHGWDLPDGTDPNGRFVSMLDPATGTGTFLVEWMRQARRSFVAESPEEDWPRHLREVVLPSMHAFESMLAPYAIAHLKVALEAEAEGGELLDSTILLTDTLERTTRAPSLDDLANPLTVEGERAEELKAGRQISVVIGNPPWDRVTKGEAGGWVVHGDGVEPGIFQDILDIANQRTIFAHVASLYNLYVYFWRWAVWKVLEGRPADPGVIAFITPSSWLDGKGFVGLRELVRKYADRIWVVDLAGDNRADSPDIDENVFDIEIPPAIVFVEQSSNGSVDDEPNVLFRRLTGDRKTKLESLARVDLLEAGEWDQVERGPWSLLRPSVGGDAWSSMPLIEDLLPWQQPGVKMNRTWPIAPDRETLLERWNNFMADTDVAVRAELFPDKKSGRSVGTRVGSLKRLADLPADAPAPPISGYYWRPFDNQRVFQDPRLAGLERPSLWQSASDEQLFLLNRHGKVVSAGPTLHATPHVPDLDSFRGNSGGKDVIPLFRDEAATAPNVTKGFLGELGTELETDVSPLDLAAYLLGVLGGAPFQALFAEELEGKEVRVPITRDRGLWMRAVELGSHVMALQTFGARGSLDEELIPREAYEGIKWESEVSVIPATPKDIGFDDNTETLLVGDGRVVGVSSEVWNYRVSGWEVLRKWLAYRTEKGTGKRSSELNEIRPERWYPEWSEQLLDLVRSLTGLVAIEELQAELLGQIMEGDLFLAEDLPEPSAEERRVPETLPQG